MTATRDLAFSRHRVCSDQRDIVLRKSERCEESGARNGCVSEIVGCIGISGHSIFLRNLGNGADVGCCLAAGASACSICIPGTFSGATGQYSNPPFGARSLYCICVFDGRISRICESAFVSSVAQSFCASDSWQRGALSAD